MHTKNVMRSHLSLDGHQKNSTRADPKRQSSLLSHKGSPKGFHRNFRALRSASISAGRTLRKQARRGHDGVAIAQYHTTKTPAVTSPISFSAYTNNRIFKRVTGHCKSESYDLHAIMIDMFWGQHCAFCRSEDSLLVLRIHTTVRQFLQDLSTYTKKKAMTSSSERRLCTPTDNNMRMLMPHQHHTLATLSGTQCALIFGNGPIVFWGFEPSQEVLVINALFSFAHGEIRQIFQCVEELQFVHLDEIDTSEEVPRSRIGRNSVFLKTYTIEEKVAVSFAIAQSVRLETFEDAMVASVVKVTLIPQALADSGAINLSDKVVSRTMGEVYLRVMDVNVVSGLRGTPTFFWENDTWQVFYVRVYDYFDIEERLKLLNTRYNYTAEVFDVVRKERQTGVTIRLEWTIIFLLIFQIAAVIFRDSLERRLH